MRQIEFGYRDNASETKGLDVSIRELRNPSNYIFRKSINGTFGQYELTQPLSASEAEKQWVVRFCADRISGEVCREAVVGQSTGDVFDQMPDWLKEILSVVLIFLTAGLFSQVNARLGAVVVICVAGVLFALGLMSTVTGGLALVVAAVLALAYKASDERF